MIEDGFGILGLITLAFVLSWRMHPQTIDLARGFVPRLPDHDLTRYGFFAVSIVGATINRQGGARS